MSVVLTDADQLGRILALVRRVLGEEVLGAYVHGSMVLGQMRPHSDLDVLVVARRRTTDEEKRALISGLLPLSGRGDPTGASRSIELTVVAQGDVRPWRFPPHLDFLFGGWMRREFLAGELTPFETPNPDLAIVLAQVIAGNRPLAGPPPEELLDPVPASDVRAAMLAGIPDLRADLEDDTANVLLTFARIWVTLATGHIHPKDTAADWALARLPAPLRPPLLRARDVYLGTANDAWDDQTDAVAATANALIAEIQELA